MKFTPSIIVSGLSGSSGGATASRWKGIGFFRARVVPANPNSADQQLQRGHMTDIVAWWHDMEAQIVAECGRLCFGMPMSGFNAFTKRNVSDLAGFDKAVPVEIWPRIMPLNAQTNPIADDLTVDVGAALSNDLDLTWSLGEADAADQVYILAGEAVDADAIPKNLFLVEKETHDADGSPITLSMPKADEGYRIFLLVEHLADSTFSIARTGWAKSKA